MMRCIRSLIIFVFCNTLALVPIASAIETLPAPERLAASPLLISGYSISTDRPNYFELYNTSDNPLNAKQWSLLISWSLVKNAPAGSVSEPIELALSNTDKYIPPKSYVVVGFGASVTNPSVAVEALSTVEANNFISEISLSNSEYKPYIKQFTTPQTQRMMLNETTTGYTSTGTYGVDTRSTIYDNHFYEIGVSAPNDFPLSPVEILANPRSCSPIEIDSACKEYVKFYNNTTAAISFSNTRLRIGFQGQSGVSVALSGTIEPGAYAIFDRSETGSALSITNTGGYVWLEDSYGIKRYESTVVEYVDASASSHKGQSWALIDGVWQWAIPSPGGANTKLQSEVATSGATSSELTPCRSDQYRNPVTNRCNLIASSSASQTPCADNQYRSEETNRCRLIVSASASSLQACASNQYRSPETNRCRLIETSSSQLTPCAENQERNPDTNRCRKIASSTIPAANFAVEDTGSSANSSIGWLAFGGVGALALGYGAWEWRREVSSIVKKIVS